MLNRFWQKTKQFWQELTKLFLFLFKEKPANLPIVIVPGWAGTAKNYQTLISSLQKQTNQKIYFVDYHQADLINIDILYDFLIKHQLAKVNLIAHSAGAINALTLARYEPQLFNKIVLVDPAGLIKDNNFSHLIGHGLMYLLNSSKDILAGRNRIAGLTVIRDLIQYTFDNPIKSLAETKNISDHQISGFIQPLLQAGIKLYLIHGERDSLFPVTEITAIAKRNHLTNFYTVPAEHNDIFIAPEPYVKIIAKILNLV
ncbi:MAG: alpha/beta hydrolase [Candidatus Buchananbacteria bacterium]